MLGRVRAAGTVRLSLASAIRPRFPSYRSPVLAYCGGMLAVRGQTLGKMAMGLRVAGPDGGNPSFWRAALRETLGKLISGYALCLGYLWMLWDGKQQTWHDKMAQTLVESAR